MAKSKHYYIRKSHRWLGLLLGLQFLLWTIGGLYFSWTSIDDVHGDPEKKAAPLISSKTNLISPTTVLENIQRIHRIDSIVSIQLIDLLGQPYYQIRCLSVLQQKTAQHHIPMMTHLANAATGALRGPLSKEEAIAVAKERFNGQAKVVKVDYINSIGAHHEYRENPLPAYAVTFDNAKHTTVYVASELGTVQKYRNNPWRIFDFFWMLHTMDYQGRDNFGNILLRVFSVFGLLTVMSGFILFFISMKTGKKKPYRATNE